MVFRSTLDRRTFHKGAIAFIASVLGVKALEQPAQATIVPVNGGVIRASHGGFTDNFGNQFKYEQLAKTKDSEDFFMCVYPAEMLAWSREHFNEHMTRSEFQANPYRPLYVRLDYSSSALLPLQPHLAAIDLVEAAFNDFVELYYQAYDKYGPEMLIEGHSPDAAQEFFQDFGDRWSLIDPYEEASFVFVRRPNYEVTNVRASLGV